MHKTCVPSESCFLGRFEKGVPRWASTIIGDSALFHHVTRATCIFMQFSSSSEEHLRSPQTRMLFHTISLRINSLRIDSSFDDNRLLSFKIIRYNKAKIILEKLIRVKTYKLNNFADFICLRSPVGRIDF